MTPKAQAVKDLERARHLLQSHLELASVELSPRTLIRQSVKKHVWAWLAAAGIGGFVIIRGLLPSSRGKIGRDNLATSAKKSGLIALILTPMLGMARQAALRFGTQFVTTHLRNHLSRHEGTHAPVREPTSHV